MSLRVSTNRAMVEYFIDHTRRISTMKLMVEYEPEHYRKVSAIKVMVEYDPNPPVENRSYGPRIQDS